MSSLIVFSNNTGVYIGTDTLSHIKTVNGIVPINFISKTVYLPQFKCCFAVQGHSLLINKLFSFSTQKVIAYDASSFWEVCKKEFHKYLNTSEFNQENIGTIFIIGYSIELKSMTTFKMTVTTKEIQFENLGNVSYIKPNISNFDEIQNKVKTIVNGKDAYALYRALTIETMKQQFKEDNDYEIAKRVGIGGQLQFTFIPPIDESKNPVYLVEMIHNFDNFLDQYSSMLGINNP